MLSIKERTFLVEWVFRCGNKYTDTVKQRFSKAFPYSVVPHRNTVRDLIKKFKSTGSVEDAERSGRPNVLSDQILLSVCDKLLANPSTSLRKLSRELEISLGSAHTAVKKITEQKQRAASLGPSPPAPVYFLGDIIENNPQEATTARTMMYHLQGPQGNGNNDEDAVAVGASEKVGVYSDFEKAYSGTTATMTMGMAGSGSQEGPDRTLLKMSPKDILLKYCQSICTQTN